MTTTRMMAVLAALAFGLGSAGCSDAGTGAAGDQAAAMAAFQEQAASLADQEFGDPGSVATEASAGGTLGLVDSAIAPRFWGRQRVVRGGPKPVVSREATVRDDSAWVTHGAAFQGIFLADTTPDGVFNPSSKPLAEQVSQQALLVRDAAARHGWRLAALSPLVWVPTAEDRRTVRIQQVQVLRNGNPIITVTDPAALYDLDGHVPVFRVGDTVQVVAQVQNTTGGSYSPPTFVFLHVRHADPDRVVWRRIRMAGDGADRWQRSWVVRQRGIDRFVIDAIDAATLVQGTADNYRANEWGIPYRIE